jgi:hypothetical protein
MTFRRILLLGALASCFLLVAGTSSQAAYSYSTALSITSSNLSGATPPVTNATGSTVTAGTLGSLNFTQVALTNISSSPLIGANTINIGNVAVNTDNATPQTFSVNYTDVITITNPTPGGSTGLFTILGTLSLAGVQSTGGASGGTITNLYSGTLTQTVSIGGTVFTVNFGNGVTNDFFGPPTVNGSAAQQGSLGANVTTIPEPASLASMGTGLVAVLGLGLRRMRRA